MVFLVCRSNYLQFSLVLLGFPYVNLVSPFYNKHYYIPRNLSAIFTGHNDVIQDMYQDCLATNAERTRGGCSSCVVFSYKN